MADRAHQALLVVSFGGPEGMDDVIPFLENVTRGRNVPRERLDEGADHYGVFGGVSPLNGPNPARLARRGRPPPRARGWRQPHQRTDPRADRRPPNRARRARDRPADLLRQ